MIEEILKEIGFNEKEAQVYLEALKLGRTTPARIAKNTGINRSTVYGVIGNLVKKGVIAEDIGGKYDYVVALPPDSLEKILDQKKRELKKYDNLVDKAINELNKLPSGIKFSLPKIRFVEESDIEEYLEKESDKWNESIRSTDGIWWGFQDPTFVANYQKWLKDYYKLKSTEGIKIQLLSTESEIEKIMENWNEPRRKIRFWKKDLNFTSTLWAAGNYAIIIQTNEHPFYLFEIYNPELTHNLREMFRGIWENLDKMN
jgi:sugar-specific transcriptional regulator TrmB